MEIALGDRGITASTTIDLMWRIAGELGLGNALLDLPSRKAVTEIIERMTGEDKCSFHEWIAEHRTDLPLDAAHDYVRKRTLVGGPKLFVSHYWGGKFRDVMYLPQYLYGAPGTTSNRAFWVDLFVVNQHVELAKQLDQIEGVIKQCEGTVLILDEEWIAPSRPWCVYELGIALREEHPIYVAFGSPNGSWTVLYALGILSGHYPKLGIVTSSVDDRDIVRRIESSKVDVEMVKQKVLQALIAAARNEVTNKAHMPDKIADEAMNLIREIGWQKVRNSGPEAQRVIGVFQRSLL